MNCTNKLAYCAAAMATSVLILTAPAGATPITFLGSSGTLGAKVTFNVSGTNLLVTLSNTSVSDVEVPSEVLTAVFFDLGSNSSNPSLTPTSALLSAGSTVFFCGGANGSCPTSGNVGGEWAYAQALSGAPSDAGRGISSSGLGLFGSGNFGGPDLQSPVAVDGLQYGLTSAGDNPATGNAPVTGQNALTQSSVDFILAGVPTGFNLDVTNVSFQYGTALTETTILGQKIPGQAELPNPVPEPGSLLLLGSGLLGFAWGRRRFSGVKGSTT